MKVLQIFIPSSCEQIQINLTQIRDCIKQQQPIYIFFLFCRKLCSLPRSALNYDSLITASCNSQLNISIGSIISYKTAKSFTVSIKLGTSST